MLPPDNILPDENTEDLASEVNHLIKKHLLSDVSILTHTHEWARNLKNCKTKKNQREALKLK